MGKGMEGQGQGMECLTPHKPLPLSEGRGIPVVLSAGMLLSNSHHNHSDDHPHSVSTTSHNHRSTTFNHDCTCQQQ
jgi:hypothetical protein